MYPSLEQATADYLTISRLARHGSDHIWVQIEGCAWARLQDAAVRRRMARALVARTLSR